MRLRAESREQRTKGEERRAKGGELSIVRREERLKGMAYGAMERWSMGDLMSQRSKVPTPLCPYALRSVLYTLCSLLFALCSLNVWSAQILDVQVTYDPKLEPLNIGDMIHFQVTTDGPGSVTVDISTVHQSIQLYDDGTNGDTIPRDNIFQLDYIIYEGDDITDGPILAHFVALDGTEARTKSSDKVPRITIDGKRPVITNDGASPNPFNPNTQFVYIRYILTESAMVNIVIYNQQNQPVRRLGTPTGKPGENHTTWNGADDLGNIMPDGLYTYQIFATDKAGNNASPTRGSVILSTVYIEIDNSLIAPNPFSPDDDNVDDITWITFDIKLYADERQLSILGFGEENYITASTEDDDIISPYAVVGISVFDSNGRARKVFSHDLTENSDSDFAPNGWPNGKMPSDVPPGSGNYLGLPNFLPDYADENKGNDWDTLVPLHGPFSERSSTGQDRKYYMTRFSVGWDAKGTPDGTYLIGIECELVGRTYEFVDYMKGEGGRLLGEKWHAVPARRHGITAIPRRKAVIIDRKDVVAVDDDPPNINSTEPGNGSVIDPTQEVIREVVVVLDDGAGGSGVDPIETKVVLIDPLGNEVGGQHKPYGFNMVKLVLDSELTISGEYKIFVTPVDKRGNKSLEPKIISFTLQDTSAPTVIPNTVIPKPTEFNSQGTPIKPYTEPVAEVSVVLTDGLTGTGVDMEKSALYVRNEKGQTLEGTLTPDKDNKKLIYKLKQPIATSGLYTIVVIAIDMAQAKGIYTYQFVMDMVETINIKYKDKTYLVIYSNTKLLTEKGIKPADITVNLLEKYPDMVPELRNLTGTAIKFQPSDIQLSQNALLTLYYSKEDKPLGIDEKEFTIYAYKTQIGEWIPLTNTVVSKEEGKLSANIDYIDEYYTIAYTNPISPSLKDEVMLKPDKLFNPDKEMLKFIFPSNVTEYQVEIYNAAGSRIITLKEQGKPDNSLGWDGKNQDNQQVNNGIFICKIWYAAGNASKTINKLIGVFR